MNASGAVLLLLGVWVIAQATGGRGLYRVGILKESGQ